MGRGAANTDGGVCYGQGGMPRRLSSRACATGCTGAVLAALAGCAAPGAEDALGAQQAPIVGGEIDDADPGVCALRCSSGADWSLCSGILVAPRVVLTSAHCVRGRDRIEVVFGGDASEPGGIDAELEAAQWVEHPNWDPSPSDLFERHHDLGLVLLPSPAPAEPVLVNRIPLNPALIGLPVRLVGFGDTSDQGWDSGPKRTATTTLRDIDSWWTTSGSATANTCVGDSGGPQLMDLGGAEVIAAITSFGVAPPDEEPCRFDSVAARVDVEVAAFVDPFIAEHDAPGVCGADGACSWGCPTPQQDPDCREQCVPDGRCADGCRNTDPDCAAGGAGAAGGSGGAGPGGGAPARSPLRDGSSCSLGPGQTAAPRWLAALGLALGALRRRRPPVSLRAAAPRRRYH